MSLAKKGFSGFIYTFSSYLANKVFLFVGGIFLARLLTPEDFGLVAMLYIFFEISQQFVVAGFGQAIIREPNLTESDKTTVFYFNLLTSILFYILLWFGAESIAKFYNRPELVILVKLMGLDLLFNSATIIQKSILTRNLKFKSLSIVKVISGFFTIGIPLLLAFYGWGVYALAVRYIIGSFISSILLFIINPWLPKGFIKKESFKKLFGFSFSVMLLGLVNTISRNLNQVAIGKYFSITSLGFFNQANTLKTTVVSTLNDTVMQVSYPMLSKLQNDKERLKNGYQRILAINTFTIFPIITLLILLAEPLILGLLGEKWKGTITFLQIISISGYFRHFQNINANILKVYGKGKDYLMQGVARNILTITGIIIAVNLNVIAMAWAFVISEFLQIFVNMYYSNKYLSFKLVEQFSLIFPIVVLTTFMGIVVFFLSIFPLENNLLKVGVLSIVGLLIYLGLAHMFKIKALNEILALVKNENKSS